MDLYSKLKSRGFTPYIKELSSGEVRVNKFLSFLVEIQNIKKENVTHYQCVMGMKFIFMKWDMLI